MVNETSSTVPQFCIHIAFALVKITIQIVPLIQLTTVIKATQSSNMRSSFGPMLKMRR